jgi:hypothetical protein
MYTPCEMRPPIRCTSLLGIYLSQARISRRVSWRPPHLSPSTRIIFPGFVGNKSRATADPCLLSLNNPPTFFLSLLEDLNSAIEENKSSQTLAMRASRLVRAQARAFDAIARPLTRKQLNSQWICHRCVSTAALLPAAQQWPLDRRWQQRRGAAAAAAAM